MHAEWIILVILRTIHSVIIVDFVERFIKLIHRIYFDCGVKSILVLSLAHAFINAAVDVGPRLFENIAHINLE